LYLKYCLYYFVTFFLFLYDLQLLVYLIKLSLSNYILFLFLEILLLKKQYIFINNINCTPAT